MSTQSGGSVSESTDGSILESVKGRHGMREETGELMLEIQDSRDLSKTYLVYEGDLSFDDLAGLARVGGLDPIKTEGNRGEWAEKVWL